MRLLLSLFLILSLSQVFAQKDITCSLQDKEIVLSKMTDKFQNSLQSETSGEMATEIGKSFLETKYVEKTLEVNGQNEKLVVNMQGLDCTTFLENVVILTRLAKKQKHNFEAFTQELQHLRYREGTIESYASRLHYFIDWLYENEQKGIIRNVSKEIGGSPYQKEINFMTANRDKYVQLKNDAFYQSLQKTETEINQRSHYYIPQNQIDAVSKKIQNGDLIAITTSIKNLDIVHVGFAIWQNEQLHLLHASSSGKKVLISQKTLAEYVKGNRIQSGIMVARLSEIE